MTTKICPKCGRSLPLTDEYFWRRAGSPYFYSYCKDCNRALARDRQARRRADIAEREQIKVEKQKYDTSERGRSSRRRRSFVDNNIRRQRSLAAGYSWDRDKWQVCLNAWDGKCAYCGASGRLTQDHFIPLCDPGCPGTVQGNIVPACRKCNGSKGRLHPAQWIKDPAVYAFIVAKLQSLANKGGAA